MASRTFPMPFSSLKQGITTVSFFILGMQKAKNGGI
jgi:hypothetical protein